MQAILVFIVSFAKFQNSKWTPIAQVMTSRIYPAYITQPSYIRIAIKHMYI